MNKVYVVQNLVENNLVKLKKGRFKRCTLKAVTVVYHAKCILVIRRSKIPNIQSRLLILLGIMEFPLIHLQLLLIHFVIEKYIFRFYLLICYLDKTTCDKSLSREIREYLNAILVVNRNRFQSHYRIYSPISRIFGSEKSYES